MPTLSEMPALLTRPSMRPKWPAVRSTQAAQLARSRASKGIVIARDLSRSPSAAASLPASRPPRLRRNPLSWRHLSTARPIPRLAPDTMMTRPSGDSIGDPFLVGVEMAGDAAFVVHLSPLRIDGAADRHDMRAARMEVAARRRVDRRRDLALDAQHRHLDLRVG